MSEDFNKNFLDSASSTDKWTPSPDFKRIVYKSARPYIDFNWKGKRTRFPLDLNAIEYCKLKGIALVNGEPPKEVLELFLKVVELLGNIEEKPVSDTKSALPVNDAVTAL